MKKVSVVVMGIGGYGAKIMAEILAHTEEFGIDLVGVVDPCYEKSPHTEELERRGVPHYADAKDFYAEKSAELAIICTPIPFHEEHCILAMENGSDCLCEKPTAAILPQSHRMAEAAKRLGRNLHVGFQLSYVRSVQALKADIAAGVFGKPLRFSTMISWPRNAAYYARSWCAKIRWNGRWVLDSIAMNACAHYLHLLFFLLGERPETAAFPEEAEAILYRGNAIETFDTAWIRAKVGETELQFAATHCGERKVNPVMRFEFEKATVEMTEGMEEDSIRAVFSDGTVKRYGAVRPDFFRKIPFCCQVVRGEEKPVCTPETALAHLTLVNAVTELVPVFSFPETEVVEDVVTVKGLTDLQEQAFLRGVMPWELTEAFGKPTKIDLKHYCWEGRL